jgi:hypothetical protein
LYGVRSRWSISFSRIANPAGGRSKVAVDRAAKLGGKTLIPSKNSTIGSDASGNPLAAAGSARFGGYLAGHPGLCHVDVPLKRNDALFLQLDLVQQDADLLLLL